MREGRGEDDPAFGQVFTSLFLPDATAEQSRWFDELQRVTMSPDNAVRLALSMSEIDVMALLPRVTVPSLVLRARREAVVPFEEGRRLATEIPGARLVPLDSRNHLVLEHEPAWPRLVDEVRPFLRGRANGMPTGRLAARCRHHVTTGAHGPT
jgi:pimeloyl-ACP methyl ester carboxylesterase